MADLDDLVCRCLAERREAAVQRLVNALESIAADGPEKQPKMQPGADSDVLLAYEDGVAEASFAAADKARRALAAWETEK